MSHSKIDFSSDYGSALPSSVPSYLYFAGHRIELRGGKTPNEGNVYFDGKPVCHHIWWDEEAKVACRIIG